MSTVNTLGIKLRDALDALLKNPPANSRDYIGGIHFAINAHDTAVAQHYATLCEDRVEIARLAAAQSVREWTERAADVKIQLDDCRQKLGLANREISDLKDEVARQAKIIAKARRTQRITVRGHDYEVGLEDDGRLRLTYVGERVWSDNANGDPAGPWNSGPKSSNLATDAPLTPPIYAADDMDATDEQCIDDAISQAGVKARHAWLKPHWHFSVPAWNEQMREFGRCVIRRARKAHAMPTAQQQQLPVAPRDFDAKDFILAVGKHFGPASRAIWLDAKLLSHANPLGQFGYYGVTIEVAGQRLGALYKFPAGPHAVTPLEALEHLKGGRRPASVSNEPRDTIDHWRKA